MYVRTKTTEGRTYLQIVESVWREGKSRQRVVATLGRIDKLQDKGDLDKIILALARYSEKLKVTEDWSTSICFSPQRQSKLPMTCLVP